jgi:hypothetical protein
MDIRIAAQWIVTVVIIAVGGAAASFASPSNIYSYEFDLPIPAGTDSSMGWMDEALLEVPDHIIICDVDVGISITHTSVFDLQIFLQSPSGTRICLNMYDSFEGFFVGENYINTIFDDEAQNSISQAEPPFTGRFRPLDPYVLSEFDSEDAFGLWRLQIYDAFYYNSGMLDSVELMITTPEPATTMFLILGAGLLKLFCARRKD